MCKIRGDFSVKSYVNANYLTHDRSRAASYRADPLISRDISVRVLLDLYETGERIVKDAAAIQAPTQLLLSGSDVVVRKKPQLEFFGRLGSTVKEKHELQGFYHDTFGEKDRHFAIEHARRFVLTTFSQPRRQCSLLHADSAGAMKEEFDRLRTPLNPVSQAAARFTIVKTGLKAGTLVSHGIRVGAEKGFDSGAMLDYVYRNQPSGFTPVGRLVDRMYLDSIGWRGIRVRKQHLEALLARATAELRAAGMPVNIIDVAAGHGRYILDSVGRGAAVDHILLRDFSADNVARGSQLIRERGLHEVAEFERADAFDRAGLAAVAPRPTLGVVSGLYELFPENETVGESLRGLADAIDAHGYLIYTGQPWHPQLELIARTLTSHRDHQPWVMRRRSQAELDELVESAGFRKMDQLTDEWGIFTVSLAQRMAS
jgi:hypothetical protein